MLKRMELDLPCEVLVSVQLLMRRRVVSQTGGKKEFNRRRVLRGRCIPCRTVSNIHTLVRERYRDQVTRGMTVHKQMRWL
jgi:hypothetical protein